MPGRRHGDRVVRSSRRRCVMKRSQALQPLSRDHHKALSVAQKMRRETDSAIGAALFLEYWREHGRTHFRIEEEVLLPGWARNGAVGHVAAARVALEHLEIRTGALAMAEGPGLDEVHDLGRRLSEHVRFEERELFELIEHDLDPTALDELAVAVSAAESSA